MKKTHAMFRDYELCEINTDRMPFVSEGSGTVKKSIF